MKTYGKRKTKTHVPGHQDCSTCHPAQKNLKARGRRDEKDEPKCGYHCPDPGELCDLCGEP